MPFEDTHFLSSIENGTLGIVKGRLETSLLQL